MQLLGLEPDDRIAIEEGLLEAQAHHQFDEHSLVFLTSEEEWRYHDAEKDDEVQEALLETNEARSVRAWAVIERLRKQEVK